MSKVRKIKLTVEEITYLLSLLDGVFKEKEHFKGSQKQYKIHNDVTEKLETHSLVSTLGDRYS